MGANTLAGSGKLSVDIVGQLLKDSDKIKPEDANRLLLNTLNGKFSNVVVNVDDSKLLVIKQTDNRCIC